MEAREFRTDNLLYYISSEGVKKVTGISYEHLEHLEYHNDDFVKVHEYIPISAEFLLKLGFKDYGDQYFGKFYSVELYGSNHQEEIQIDLEDPNDIIIKQDSHGLTRIKYIHQLQNLYFALTGEELEYKETPSEV